MNLVQSDLTQMIARFFEACLTSAFDHYVTAGELVRRVFGRPRRSGRTRERVVGGDEREIA